MDPGMITLKKIRDEVFPHLNMLLRMDSSDLLRLLMRSSCTVGVVVKSIGPK